MPPVCRTDPGRIPRRIGLKGYKGTEWVNRNVSLHNPLNRFVNDLGHVPGLRGLMRRAGWKDKTLMAYNAYLTLKPIQYLLQKRNKS